MSSTRARGAETARSRYSDFFVTLDTHVVSATDDVDKHAADMLIRTIKKFCTPAVLKEVLIQEVPNKLRMATLTNASVEVGDKYKRIHAHFNISILHETNLGLVTPEGVSINTLVADWFNTQLEPETGTKCYASVRLSESSRAKNYAIKHGAVVEPLKVGK